MAEEAVSSASKTKESETLCTNSLVQLARGLAKENCGLQFAMLLNIPTTTIINVTYDTSADGLLNDESGTVQASVVEKCICMWRQFTADQKNKERIKTLEKVTRELGKNELADAILDRYQNHQEITADIFA